MRLDCYCALNLALVLLSTSCGPRSVSKLKILNGVQGDERFGATLALTADGRSLCSASLISPFHALTARHCVALIQENLTVHVGGDSRNPQETAEVKRVYTLPYLDEAPESSIQLNGDSWERYDIALLELKSPIRSVQPYNLLDRAYDWGETLHAYTPLAKKTTIIAGYGRTGDNESNFFRHHTEVTVDSLRQGIAESTGVNTGACNGDSGGSILFSQAETGTLLLGGALSTGSTCMNDSTVHNAYALTYPHLCWMKQIIHQNPETHSFASHIRCNDAGVVETLEPIVMCPELTSTLNSQTLLDAVAGAVGRTDCAQIKHELRQGLNLSLFGLQIRDVELLQDSVISKLDLSYNNIEDMSKWNALSVNDELNIAHNRISELSSLKHLDSLKTLNFDHNQVKEIPTNQWKNLNILRFFDNQVSHIPDLSALTKLEIIKAGRNQIATIDSLPSSLREVYLQQNRLKEASFMHDLRQIEKLFLYENQLETIQLDDKPQLSWLTLEKNRITSLSLNSLPNLHVLDFSDNPIEKIQLNGLSNLRSLHADNANLSSIPELSHLTTLQELSLRNNRIEILDVNRLPRSLTHLELGWNQIKDISSIVVLENLEILSLHGSDINNLEPLLNLTKLKYVAIDDPDNRHVTVRDELERRGVQVSMNSSYGNPEIDLFYLHQNLKAQFPELLNMDVTDEQAVFLVSTTRLGQVIKNRNIDLPDSFVNALLHEVFEPAAGQRYRLRVKAGERVFRYVKKATNYF